jgi:membrane-associated phospholipid phosphatase
LGGSATLFEDALAHAPCSGLCGSSEIALGIDRSVVGNHSVAARRWSDGLIAGLTIAPLLLVAADHGWQRADSREALLTDTVLLAQTASVNLALNTVVKHAVGRKRPLTYDSSWTEADRSSADASLSFYSGHSATAFAMATATSRLFMIRHPDSDWVLPLWLGSEALAATTAVLRVEAGKHFWSDVAVGALVGSAVGYLVPQLHLREQETGSVARVAPMVVDDGGALVFSLR